VAAGFNSVGIASAGGAGRALAEWVVNGSPTSDLTNVDIRRFARFHGNVQWLHDRVGEVLGLHYAVPWPNRELESGRPFRRSPVHSELQAHGASFGSKMGWERPNFFVDRGSVNGGSVRADPVICYGWGRQNWHDWSHREQLATRNAVALFDQTSFGKLLIVGPDAERALQWVCAADASVAVGRTVYTGLLNERGGYESDVTVTRTGREEYLLITGAASVIHDLDHLRRNFPADARVNVVDVTSSYAVFGVMGPNARLLLQKLSRTDLSEQAFGFATSQEIDLGHCTVRATRITYVGELGWELYVPAEFAVGVYHLLSRAGSEFGLVNAGYYALNGLRIEKGYRAFGSDITPDSNPVEAGLRFATKLDTDIDFLGRAALERAVAGGVSRRLTSLVVDDPSVTMWGGELLLRNGAAVGQVTSAAWGATIGSCVGLAYRWRADGEAVTAADLNGSDYQVNVGGTISSVTLSQQAPYDPKSLRTKS
ncbi:MAG: FAD-dependent oxidoreductase, partial [Frankiales bacterium]|nr:FAD-dependent oxidoreductase [Frankiales bacterium]